MATNTRLTSITWLRWGYFLINYTTARLWDVINRPCMVMSSNGNRFFVTGHLCGEFTGHRWNLAQRPVTRSFNVFFDLRLKKRSSKQSWGWWFETLSRPLWRHCNARTSTTVKLNTVEVWIWMTWYVINFYVEMITEPCLYRNVSCRSPWKLLNFIVL